MSKVPVDLVVFDLMGTLVRDLGAMERALKEAVAHYRIPHSEASRD